jgi:PhnB protein
MTTLVNPYINFDGNAREAMEFYAGIFGGKLEMNTFEEFNLAKDPADNNKLMHAQLTMENGMVLMGSDIMTGMVLEEGSRVSITLSGDDETELRGFWDKLAIGAEIVMPMERSPWNDFFGMLTDRYGIRWMVNINMAPQSA